MPAAVATTPHPDGQPFSRNTYNRYKCRCEGCRKENADYKAQRKWRQRATRPEPSRNNIEKLEALRLWHEDTRREWD